jgi:hypothetical protein
VRSPPPPDGALASMDDALPSTDGALASELRRLDEGTDQGHVLRCGVSSVELDLEGMMPALGTRRGTVAAELLLLHLLLFVRVLELHEGRRQLRGLHAKGRSLSPCAAPSANGAA